MLLKIVFGLSTPILLFSLNVATALADEMDAQHGAYFLSPEDGATVSSPVTVAFGLRPPYGVAPAGVAMDNTGHHHLIINAELPDMSQPIPKDDNHRHFGGGQTETSLALPPGKHTLQLLLGDFKHTPHPSPIISEQITIYVK